MLQVMIVDDEPSAIKSLKYLLDWEQYGFEIAAEAYNGVEALELLRNEPFALIITDIRMPEMDGLELVEKVRFFSDLPIMIVSGYDEFEYARQCMRWGVRDYLLKPVDRQELAGKLEQIYREIDEKRQKDRMLYHGQTVMRNHLLREWTHGYLEDAAMIEELGSFGIMKNQSYRVLLVEPEGDNPDHAGPEQRLQRFAIQNVLEEAAAPNGYVFTESDMRFGIVLMGKAQQLEEDRVRQQAEHCIEAVKTYTKHRIVMVAGPAVTHLHDVVYSYLTALTGMEREVKPDRSSILILNDLAWQQENQSHQVVEEMKKQIHAQYHKNVSMRLIASQLFMNAAYLGQLFKAAEGLTFHEYLLKTRMEKAKQLLTTTDKKVYEVAAAVGYKELDWFYKKFKEYTGQSASEFKADRT